MFRLANAQFGAYTEITKMVSANLINMIETVLGIPDKDGKLTDTMRIEEFMSQSQHLKWLVGKSPTFDNGLLTIIYPWSLLFAERYSDMLAKLKDQKHIYTFDELGEALLFDMIETTEYADMDYLEKYGIGYYSEEALVSEAIPDYQKMYDAIYVKIEKHFRRCVEDFDKNGENDKFYQSEYLLKWRTAGGSDDDFISMCSHSYTRMVSDYSHYLKDEEDIEAVPCYTGHKECERIYEKIGEPEDICGIFLSPLLWDTDYEMILELLSNKESLDDFLKKNAKKMGFTLKNFNSMFSAQEKCEDFVEESLDEENDPS